MTQSLKTMVLLGISVSVILAILTIKENIVYDTMEKPEGIVSPKSLSPALNDLQYQLSPSNSSSETKPKGKPRDNLSNLGSPKPTLLKIKVKRGDTLTKLLAVNGIRANQAAAITASLREIYDLKKLRIGQDIKLTIVKKASSHKKPVQEIIKLSFLASFDKKIIVKQQENGTFKGKKVNRKLKIEDTVINGVINFNLYQSAIDNTMPLGILMELIQIYSFDVDFQREVKQGDEFSVLFSVYLNDQGQKIHNGTVFWASLTVGGEKIEYSRFTSKSGITDYYDSRGQSAKKTLMRTPINGARLSSSYGKRRHPILGYTKIHRGVDFAAPRGAPIMAAGDGMIESIGHNGAYGKYIRIRHNSIYKTAYAHLSRYGKHMKQGHRVQQGATIGYVGSTGKSTGPHLHYEVIKNGRQTNPMSVRLPAGEKLNKSDLAMFKTRWLKLKNRVSIALQEKN
jgi:murein DD-endopeptidase MepM/ murein hydrolase activator NlpD